MYIYPWTVRKGPKLWRRRRHRRRYATARNSAHFSLYFFSRWFHSKERL